MIDKAIINAAVDSGEAQAAYRGSASNYEDAYIKLGIECAFKYLESQGYQLVKWEPIESAPKDGTQILLFNAGNGGCFCGEWEYLAEDFMPIYRGVVTAWMPLPAPPTKEDV